MKVMKKFASLALMLALAMSMIVPAFAANVTINVNNPEGSTDSGETYTVYKIFDASIAGETTNPNGENPDGTVSEFANVSYTIDSNSPFFTTIQNFPAASTTKAFALTQVGSSTTWVVQRAQVDNADVPYDAADLAVALKAVIDDPDTPADALASVRVLQDVKSGFRVDNAAYYLIISSLGSRMIVDTIGQKDMTISTKNDFPTLTKKVTSAANPEAVDDTAASYGETVTFHITVNIPATAKGAITVHDTMDANLEYDSLVPGSGATAAVRPSDNHTVDFTLDADAVATAVASIPAGEDSTDVVISYTAKVLTSAPVDGTKMVNDAFLTYSNYTSAHDTATVSAYAFDLVKTSSDETDSKLLDGAVFQLYAAATGGDPVHFTYADGVYSVDPAGTVTDITVTGGKVYIKGLASGAWYLEELTPPRGLQQADRP